MGRCQICASRQNCTKILLHRDAWLKLDKEKKRADKIRKEVNTSNKIFFCIV